MAWKQPTVQHALQRAVQVGSALHAAYNVGKAVMTVGRYIAPLLI